MNTPPTVTALLIEDNALERFVAREALEQAGMKVVEAETGTAGIAAFEQVLPDIVLLDVRMPKMNGFEVCEAIRALGPGAHVPILMLTGLDDVDSINRAYQTGATDFYAKPVNCAVLIHRIKYLLRAKRTADELRESRSMLANAQRMAKLGYWEWNADLRPPRWSDEIETILGSAPELDGEPERLLRTHIHPDDLSRFDAAMLKAASPGGMVSLEHRVICPDRTERVVHQELQGFIDQQGRLTRILGTIQDVTARRRTESRIHQLAYFDAVTGLPNRTMLKDLLSSEIARAERSSRVVAVLFLDLDQFKRVNDTFGHGAGDELLRIIARRLTESTREDDCIARFDSKLWPPAKRSGVVTNTVARLGGDEFVIVLPDLNKLDDAALVARRICSAVREPMQIGGVEIYISTSIGITGSPDDGNDIETLLKNADAAMYHAKSEGRDRFQFFTQSMNSKVSARLALEMNLRRALKEDELRLHYQPIVDVSCGRTISMEALLRWERPGEEVVLPGEFIPVAEETGLIIPLGEWVLQQACLQLAHWQALGLSDVRVSVNVSAAQFSDRSFPNVVSAALASAAIDPAGLELELTESMLMIDTRQSEEVLRSLKALGVHIAIDDFGTGYSSLAYLKRFPLDCLKIDRSFIRDIAFDADDSTIVAATIGLARSLGLRVTAEGVEDETQLQFLREHACHACQGYLFAAPMPVDDMENWLSHRDELTMHIPSIAAGSHGRR